MGRKSAAAKVLVHMPETEEASRELASRAAAVHADIVIRYIQKLNCPAAQKLKLLDSLITSAQSD